MGGHVNKLVNVCFEDGKCKVLGSEHYYYTTAYIIITLPALATSIRASDGYTGVSPFVLLPQPPAPASRFSYPGTRALPCLVLQLNYKPLLVNHAPRNRAERPASVHTAHKAPQTTSITPPKAALFR